jgi:cytochrome c-type biogenesis protein CcmH
MNWGLRSLLVIVALLCATPLRAVQVDEMMSDPVLEARARTISHELRCMVCQNQSIDDSEAPLARDLRLLVRERLKAGDSDVQVLDFMVERYGEFVLLKPRMSEHTIILWATPLALLIIGFIAAGVTISRRPVRSSRDDVAELSQAEREKLATIQKAQAE